MSLVSFIGPRPNILDLEGTSRRKRLEVRQPILTNEDLEKIRCIGHYEDRFDTKTIDITYPAARGRGRHGRMRSTRLCERAEAAVHGGYNIIILSDRLVGPDRIPIPALLATAAVHHHLIRKGLRTSVGLVVETGEPREIHHFACLAGYGAEAINPYLAFETLRGAACGRRRSRRRSTRYEVVKRYIKSVGKGLLKVMSKMGISTYQSYCGAQIFDAVGLTSDFVEQLFLRHRHRDRGRRPGRDRRGDGAPPPRRLRRRAGLPQRARCRRRIRLPHPRRGPCLDAGHRRARSSMRCAATRRTRYEDFAELVNDAERSGCSTIRGLFQHQDGRRARPRSRCRSTRSSRPPTSSSASSPAPCPSARSRARRMRRSPSP